MMRWLVLVGLVGCSKILGFTDPTHTDAPLGDTCGFTMLTAGREFTCGLAVDATVWCWGRNGDGQVAPGGAAIVLAATRVDLPSAAAEVRGGRNSTCARLTDGSVWCWGDNASGALGDGTTGGHGPVQVALGSEKAVELAVGAHHACIRRESDSAIMCWGDNTDFALGNAGAAIQPMPQLVVGTAGSAHIITGHRDACVLDAVGHPQCWGRNAVGELGTAGPSRAVPMAMTGIDRVQQIGATGHNTCVVDANGDLRCWGRNTSGQLGDGTYNPTTLPGPVMLSNVAAVELVPDGMMSVGTDGAITGGGSIALDGTYGVHPTPTRSSLTNVTGLSAGFYHYCALVDHEPMCWGTSNDAGELGRGTRSFSETPAAVPLAGTVDALASSFFPDVCARVGGKLLCWGINAQGEVGDGTLFARQTPTEVTTGLSTIDGVTMVWSHACAWGNGAVSCWGDNRSGQLGNGTTAVHGSAPVTAAVTGVTAVTTGQGSTCAITSTGVKCWGAGNFGRLGNGGMTNSSTPVAVMGFSSATALAQGFAHACAISSGTVYCWGLNDEGEVGDGSTMNRATAVPVTLPASATKLALGQSSSCALLSTGTIYCWGGNYAGQLGLGDKTDRSQPMQVTLPGGTTAVDVFAGVDGACARLATNAVVCWGNTIIASATAPVGVPALDGATRIAIGSEGGCATLFGQLSCWGSKLMRADATVTTDWQAQPITLSCSRGM